MSASDTARGPDDERDRVPGTELRAFLDRIRAGDEAAARELLARYEAQVRLVVRRQLPALLRSRFDSLDFIQSGGDAANMTDLAEPDERLYVRGGEWR